MGRGFVKSFWSSEEGCQQPLTSGCFVLLISGHWKFEANSINQDTSTLPGRLVGGILVVRSNLSLAFSFPRGVEH